MSNPTFVRGAGNPGWPKGVSGNPNGRKPVGKTLAEAVRGVVDPIEWAQETWKRAKKGSVQALEVLADRGWGKAPIHVMLQATTQKYDLEKLTDVELAVFENLIQKMENERLSELTDNQNSPEPA
jgi:hypothetical protein